MAQVKNFFKTAIGLLAYNATSPNSKCHSVAITGPGQKRIDNIYFSYVPQSGGADPATIRTGKIIIAEGNFDNQDLFIDPMLTLAAQVLPVQLNVILELPTSGGSHRVMSLTNVGIFSQDSSGLVVILTPAYRSGDTDNQPGLTMASLMISGVSGNNVFGNDPNKEIKWELA